MISGAIDRPTYLLTACRMQDRPGIYGWDIHNRSRMRRSLQRLGFELSDQPFLHLKDGSFVSPDLGEFHPEFFIFRAQDPDDPHQVVESSHAGILFMAAAARMGLIPATELPQLRAALRDAQSVAAGDPAAIASALYA